MTAGRTRAHWIGMHKRIGNPFGVLARPSKTNRAPGSTNGAPVSAGAASKLGTDAFDPSTAPGLGGATEMPPPPGPGAGKRPHQVRSAPTETCEEECRVRERRPSHRFGDDCERFGAKTAALIALRSMVDNELAPFGPVAIPRFVGISHDEVAAHLARCAPELDASWQAFCDAQAKHGGRGLSEEGKVALARVRGQVEEAFSLRLRSEDERPDFLLPPAFMASVEGQRLMVRSSGREDLEAFANAGGNVSIPNVPADPFYVRDAVGKVVASYFGEKSIQQRLMAGDDVRVAPSLSVLIQEMAAEQPDGAIFASGVLFTQEPEGLAPGLAKIQATFGHNEAVVSASLPGDSYYVRADGTVHEVRRPKEERLVPSTDRFSRSLKRERNPAELRDAPAIAPQVVERLHQIGRIIAADRGTPMDIEWTYDPAADKIWLLQARPQAKRRAVEPTHLRRGAIVGTPRLESKVIGAGDGQVRIIVGPQAVVLGRDLAEALDVYLEREDKDSIRAALTTTPSDPTSHEAATLGGESVPVLLVRDLGRTRAFISDNGPVLLDPGTGTLVGARALLADAPPGADPITHLRSIGVIAAGWGRYPVREELTILEQEPPPLQEAFDFLLHLRSRIHDGEAIADTAKADGPPTLAAAATVLGDIARALDRKKLDSILADGPDNRLEKLLDLATRGEAGKDRATAIGALLVHAHQLSTRAAAKVPELEERATRLFLAALSAAQRVSAAEAMDPGGLTHLFELGGLRAVFAQPTDRTVVAADSYLSLLSDQREVGSEGLSVDDFALSYRRVAKLALRSEVQAAWSEFTTAVAASREPPLDPRIAAVLKTTQDFGMTARWLNSTFLAAWQSCEGCRDRARACLALIEGDFRNAANRQVLAWAEQRSSALRTWIARIPEWEDPDRFDDLLRAFSREVGVALEDAAKLYDGAPPLGRQALVGWLRGAVDLYDQTLKSMKSSSRYRDLKVKAQRFHALLGPYLRAMDSWCQCVPELLDYGAYSSRGPLKNALSRYQEFTGDGWLSFSKMDQARAAESLRPSGFNVSLAKLGSPLCNVFNSPGSLEDLFTLAHQNLLTVISAAESACGLKPEVLPERLQEICAGLTKDGKLVGISFEYPKITVEFCKSLNEHGLKMTLAADVRDPETAHLSLAMFGAEEHDRKKRIQIYMSLFGRALGVPFAPGHEPGGARGGASCTWEVPIQSDAGRQFIRSVPDLIKTVGDTCRPRTSTRLRDILRTLRAFTPGVDQALERLDADYFRRYPWYNGEFAQELLLSPNGEKALQPRDWMPTTEIDVLVTISPHAAQLFSSEERKRLAEGMLRSASAYTIVDRARAAGRIAPEALSDLERLLRDQTEAGDRERGYLAGGLKALRSGAKTKVASGGLAPQQEAMRSALEHTGAAAALAALADKLGKDPSGDDYGRWRPERLSMAMFCALSGLDHAGSAPALAILADSGPTWMRSRAERMSRSAETPGSAGDDAQGGAEALAAFVRLLRAMGADLRPLPGALAAIGKPLVVPALVELAHGELTQPVAFVLTKIPGPAAGAAFGELIARPALEPYAGDIARAVMGGPNSAHGRMFAESPNWKLRLAFLRAVNVTNAPGVRELITALEKDGDARVRSEATAARKGFENYWRRQRDYLSDWGYGSHGFNRFDHRFRSPFDYDL